MANDFLSDAAKTFSELLGKDSGLGVSLRIDVVGAGAILIDARRKPNAVSVRDGEADGVIVVEPDVFASIMRGDLDPQIAFRRGRLQIRGDVAGAISVTRYLGERARPVSQSEDDER